MSVSTSRLPWVAGGLAAAAVGAFLVFKFGLFSPSSARPEDPNVGGLKPPEIVPVPKVRFTDVTKKWGIDFRHHTGAFGMKLLPETMGSGVAVIDFDNDGRPDLLFVNSRPWPGYQKKGEPLPTLRFFRNLGKGKFKEVTKDIGLGVSLYGMGVAVGDFDNDGYPDLFITAVGGNRLFQNVKAPVGKGVNGRMFQDVTASAGVGGPGGWPKLDKPGEFLKHDKPICWSTSAAFLDYDGDGRLDLFVCNYVTWSPTLDLAQKFTLTGKGRSYGPPTSFEGAQCFLYRNLGGGKFEDVSEKAGVQVFQRGGTDTDRSRLNVGKSLGVIVADVDDDGWPDVIVANDTVRNFLFRNVPDPKAPGGRRFEEVGQEAGVAYAQGNAQGAMGIDWGPNYRPGKSALLIGNFADQPDTFLCQDDPRDILFSDAALVEGISGPSQPLLKFGVFFFDYDLDGRLDFLTCNGHLDPEIGQVQQSQSYAQRPQLFWNTGTRFEEVTAKAAGPDLFQPLVGRGCAYADLDGDGKPDVILTANGGPARVLRNEGGTGNHWLRLKLVGDGERSNVSAIGAQVTLGAGGVVQKREVCSARGYMSQSELVLTFGLGKETKVDRITIRWPGKDAGPPQVLTGLAVDKEHRIEQKPAK